MAPALGRIGLLVLLAIAAPAAFAQDDDVAIDEEVLSNEELILLLPGAFLPGDVNDGRQDVREVTMPPAPSGPATPVPFCNPSDPICP
jgi:hypothetical protein